MKRASIVTVLVLVVLGGYQLARNHYDDAWHATTRPIQPSENLSPAVPYTPEQLDQAHRYMQSIKSGERGEAEDWPTTRLTTRP